ncbi:hypothetical protein B296_00016081 [Ensete ventricosum]|uniref:Uncharacterized protein n=1 Tax=Ensete ventricosum TaxID=4639 RepID=A0A426Z8U4_ENSVE|nr:hypothetical protein B296_00016081 [Ensete ventricosum]
MKSKKWMANKAEKDTSQGEGRGSSLEKDKAKGKEPTKESTEGPGHCLTMKELYEMGGRAGNVKYFAAWVTDLPGLEIGAPMKVCWIDLLAPSYFWDDGLVAVKYARGMLPPSIAKQLYGAPSKELID